MKTISDAQLQDMIIQADDEQLAAGRDPKDRAFWVPMRVMEQLGFDGYVMAGPGTPPILERIRAFHGALYRPADTGVGGVHLGAFMFRDVFARVSVPIILGSPGINMLEMSDLNAMQKRWLQARPEDLAAYQDQVIDLFDFGYGLMELGHTRPLPDEAKNFIGLAHFQLQAAAAIVTGAYDFRGAVQSALIATELALKGGLSCHGVTNKEMQDKYGHKLAKLASAVADKEPGFDAARVNATLAKFPAYVANRYGEQEPDRQETGRIVMGAQFIAAEVTRQLTDRNWRKELTPPIPRAYPPI